MTKTVLSLNHNHRKRYVGSFLSMKRKLHIYFVHNTTAKMPYVCEVPGICHSTLARGSYRSTIIYELEKHKRMLPHGFINNDYNQTYKTLLLYKLPATIYFLHGEPTMSQILLKFLNLNARTIKDWQKIHFFHIFFYRVYRGLFNFRLSFIKFRMQWDVNL